MELEGRWVRGLERTENPALPAFLNNVQKRSGHNAWRQLSLQNWGWQRPRLAGLLCAAPVSKKSKFPGVLPDSSESQEYFSGVRLDPERFVTVKFH